MARSVLKNRCAAGLFVCALLIPSSLLGATRPIQGLNSPRLIEAGELAGWLDHPSVRVVDMRTSLLDYLKGHIPGAIYLSFETLRLPSGGIPAQMPDRICLERLIGENLGILNTTAVIVYSERSNPNAAYLAWILEYLGHRKVAILNGGWEKWASENRPVTQEYPALKPGKFFAKVVQEEVLAEKKWIRKRLSSTDVLIVDARPPKQYSGEEGEEIRRGHIPGARNLFWDATLEGNEIRTWKSREDLQKLSEESGIAGNKEIVVHCRTGREASHVYFTLKHVLGLRRVRLYRGSWVEWSADRSLPIKTGAEP